MLSAIKTKIYASLDEHMMEVVCGAGVAFGLKILGAALQFGFSVLLARTLGAEGAGIYFLALTICTVAWAVGCFGLENSLLRFVAAGASKFDWGAVKAVYRKSMAISSLTSVALSALVFVMAPSLALTVFNKPELTDPLRYMALAIWPMTMVLLQGESIKGLKRIRDSQLVNGVVVPAVALSGLMLIGNRFGILGAVGAYGLAAVAAAAIGAWLWHRSIPKLTPVKTSFATRTLLKSCVPLMLVSASYLVMQWSSTFALGIWGTKTDIGIFSVALRTANLTSFILISVNSIVAPKFSELYSRDDLEALENTARKSALLMTLIASPILLSFLVFPQFIMGIFGSGFVDGGYLLSIIAVGQFINVATGSVGFLLVMTGHERLMRNNTMFVALFAVVLNLVLVPRFGALGAAISTSMSIAMVNMISLYLVWRSLRIVAIALPRRTRP